MRIALCQIPVSPDPVVNLSRARDALREAGPAAPSSRCSPRRRWRGSAPTCGRRRSRLTGRSAPGSAAACAAAGVAAVAGVFEPSADGRVYNTAVAFSAAGDLVASYRKLHLFDALGQRESDLVAPGDDVVVTSLAGVTVGLQICYDIRFPELTRALAIGGASLVTVSAAWQAGLFKEEHWVTLLRARAIENTIWIAAAGQVPDTEREADPRADRRRPVHAHRPARRGPLRPGAVGRGDGGRRRYGAGRVRPGHAAVPRQPPGGPVLEELGRPPEPQA